MIIVIADDITGAAELAGIALRHGARTIMSAEIVMKYDCDVLIVYTNARSMEKEHAVALMQQLTVKAAALRPQFIYKKTDSVLRGHVYAELVAQMKILGYTQALLVPANPGLGRTIVNGQYYINSKLLHETNFAVDPEFPAVTSDVKAILAENGEVVIRKAGESLQPGINVGEASTVEDIVSWTKYSNWDMLLAGGGYFFDFLMAGQFKKEPKPMEAGPLERILFVSGTAFRHKNEEKEVGWLAQSFMPSQIFSKHHQSEADLEEWAAAIISLISRFKKVLVAIALTERGDPVFLREKLAEVVRMVMQRTSVNELVIAGGSTAFSIVESLGWKELVPYEELSYGVVRMRVNDAEGIFLTIKPGSYPWPSRWKIN